MSEIESLLEEKENKYRYLRVDNLSIKTSENCEIVPTKPEPPVVPEQIECITA